MKRLACSICVMTLLLGYPAGAQSPNNLVGGSKFNPPPPPPPPKIEVPVIPKMDAPPHYDYVSPRRPTFHDRVSRCLDEAASAGFGSGDRDYYVRSCLNH